MTKVDFFCRRCRLDQVLLASQRGNNLAIWHEAQCQKCKQRLIRYVSERHADPYFQESIKFQEERDKYKKDLIQPGQEGFKMHYKKEWNKLEKEKERKVKTKKSGEQARDKLLKEFGHDPVYRKALHNVEDKLEEQNGQ